ncbi:MAG: glucose-6-phosphate isomerase [Rhodobacterales bacterium]|nr:MAG: glucose-6-phosphate isomerase [Rhodobacterales bacterium]
MRKPLIALPLVGAMALSACMSPAEEEQLGYGLGGGMAGLITAKMLGANKNWTILATIAGAAAGTMVAKNRQTGQCAYSNGDGTYRTGPCG